MSKSGYYFRFYRQSQDGATIPEELDQIGGGVGGVGSDRRRHTVVLEDRIIHSNGYYSVFHQSKIMKFTSRHPHRWCYLGELENMELVAVRVTTLFMRVCPLFPFFLSVCIFVHNVLTTLI